MAIFALKVDVIPRRRTEFVQTAAEIIERIQREDENIEARLYQDMADPDSLLILTEWKTPGSLERHMKSDYFKALRWAVSEMADSRLMNLGCGVEFDKPWSRETEIQGLE
jgi:quinol monooxygenase YgiN